MRRQGGGSCARAALSTRIRARAMQLFQVKDGSGSSRLGVRRGEKAIVLERPQAGIATVLQSNFWRLSS